MTLKSAVSVFGPIVTVIQQITLECLLPTAPVKKSFLAVTCLPAVTQKTILFLTGRGKQPDPSKPLQCERLLKYRGKKRSAESKLLRHLFAVF